MEHTHVIWYKDAATVIALIALLVSVVSWLISLFHTQSQDRQTAHQDLRVVLQRLLEVARENNDRMEKYANDQAKMIFANALASQEMNVLAAQGAKSARMLGPKWVASAEYLTIARAQAEAGDFESQGFFIEQAVQTAKTENAKMAALRDSANFLFARGRIAEGRDRYEQQISLLRGISNYPSTMIVSTGVEIRLAWAQVEAESSDDLTAAQAQVQAAVEIIQSLPAGPLRTALQNRVDTFVRGGQPVAPSTGVTNPTGFGQTPVGA